MMIHKKRRQFEGTDAIKLVMKNIYIIHTPKSIKKYERKAKDGQA
jgi:hypothetical protein